MNTLAFLQGIGAQELMIILVIILLLFGAKKLPELARGLGKSMKEFKKATQEVQDDFQEAMDAVDIEKDKAKANTKESTNPDTVRPAAKVQASADKDS